MGHPRTIWFPNSVCMQKVVFDLYVRMFLVITFSKLGDRIILLPYKSLSICEILLKGIKTNMAGEHSAASATRTEITAYKQRGKILLSGIF